MDVGYPQRNPIKVFKEVAGGNLLAPPCRKGKTFAGKPVTNRVVLGNVGNVPRRTLPRQAKSSTNLTKEKANQITIKPEVLKEKTSSLVAPSLDMTKVKDIDAEDSDNPMLSCEYVKDIYAYLHVSEKRLAPTDYLKSQTEISEKMRMILIDWLIQV